jgi:flagellar biosynthesis/type III secretory pathway chaperone
MQREIVKLKAERLRELWQEFCHKHTELYDITCDEYMHLLASNIEDLEETIQQKTALINYVNGLDGIRTDLIGDLSESLNLSGESKLIDLIQGLKAVGEEKQAVEIEKLNLLLLDIVEKIQEQNKKNQIFLNKALHSLNELKESFVGHKTYKTYSSTGGLARSNNGY